MLSFEKIKPLGNGKITLLLTDRGKSCLSRGLMISKICLNTIHENKILAKISKWLEFDVFVYGYTVRSFLP